MVSYVGALRSGPVIMGFALAQANEGFYTL